MKIKLFIVVEKNLKQYKMIKKINHGLNWHKRRMDMKTIVIAHISS